jgi:hypothetical protein
VPACTTAIPTQEEKGNSGRNARTHQQLRALAAQRANELVARRRLRRRLLCALTLCRARCIALRLQLPLGLSQRGGGFGGLAARVGQIRRHLPLLLALLVACTAGRSVGLCAGKHSA